MGVGIAFRVAAFEGLIFMNRTRDYEIRVREDVMAEEDGPMLRHGLQGLDRQRILLPRSAVMRPDRDRLARRYEEFRRAG